MTHSSYLLTDEPDMVPMPSVDDEQKQRDWAALEAEARDFARRYGVPALLRCISFACVDKYAQEDRRRA